MGVVRGSLPPPSPAHTNPASALADGISLGAGILFSVWLVAIYAPVAVILNRRLTILVAEEAKAHPHSFDLDKWKLAHRVESSPFDAISGYLAFLLPLITSIVAKLFKLE